MSNHKYLYNKSSSWPVWLQLLLIAATLSQVNDWMLFSWSINCLFITAAASLDQLITQFPTDHNRFFFSAPLQVENRALRLREPSANGEITAALLADPQQSSSQQMQQQMSSTSPQNYIASDSINIRLGSIKHKSNRNLNHYNTNNDVVASSAGGSHSQQQTSGRVSWDYFDESGYISRGGLRTGEDPYIRNRFNQQASDSLSSNRDIPDTRNPMWVKLLRLGEGKQTI